MVPSIDFELQYVLGHNLPKMVDLYILKRFLSFHVCTFQKTGIFFGSIPRTYLFYKKVSKFCLFPARIKRPLHFPANQKLSVEI